MGEEGKKDIYRIMDEQGGQMGSPGKKGKKRDIYDIMAEKHGYPDSPEYRRVLEAMVTPLEARVGLALPSPPDHATAEELAARLKLDVKTVNEAIESLFRKGMANQKGFRPGKSVRFTRGPYFMFMASLAALNVDAASSPVCKAWYDFARAQFYRDLAKILDESDIPMGRIIPYYKALPDSPDVNPAEDIREFVKKARIIAVSNCSCRQCFAGGQEPCKMSHNYEVCMNFGRSAEFLVERGVARVITPEEALKIFGESEERGLFHAWDRFISTMCNCCNDCCFVMRPCLDSGVPFSKAWIKSRYTARTNNDLCSGCETCVGRCVFGAIEMRGTPGTDEYKAVVDEEKCFGCGACVITCPTGARTFELVRPPEYTFNWESQDTWLRKVTG